MNEYKKYLQELKLLSHWEFKNGKPILFTQNFYETRLINAILSNIHDYRKKRQRRRRSSLQGKWNKHLRKKVLKGSLKWYSESITINKGIIKIYDFPVRRNKEWKYLCERGWIKNEYYWVLEAEFLNEKFLCDIKVMKVQCCTEPSPASSYYRYSRKNIKKDKKARFLAMHEGMNLRVIRTSKKKAVERLEVMMQNKVAKALKV